MKTTGKSAFTLLELIVVIGIIGILMGVILTQFGGSTDSAKAAKCETNMRNLVTAAHTCALEDRNGCFPAAGSFSYFSVDHKKAEVVYGYRIGWISGYERRAGTTKSAVGFQPVPFNAEEVSLRNALTNGCNGSMWKAMGGTRTAYQCPVHAEAVSKLLKRPPGWSYAMNREFGHEKTGGNKWHAKTKEDPNSAKILMFAELQGANISGRDYAPIDASSYIKAGAPLSDAVLDYDTESIGFNHKIGSRGFAGHVAFTDGHVEKIFYPKSGGGGLSLLKLTEALCKGHEISYDGRGYKDLQQ